MIAVCEKLGLGRNGEWLLMSRVVFLGRGYWKYSAISKKKRERVAVVTQRKWIWLVSMRIRVRSLASLSGSGISHCCGCGVGQQLQLRFDPLPGNFHMPQVQPYKAKKEKKKKERKEKILWNQIVMMAAQLCEHVKNITLYLLNGWIIWYVNYISIKLY